MVVPVDLVPAFVVSDEPGLNVVFDLDVADEVYVLVGVTLLAELLLLAHALEGHRLLHFQNK